VSKQRDPALYVAEFLALVPLPFCRPFRIIRVVSDGDFRSSSVSRHARGLDALPLQHSVASIRRAVIVFVRNDEVPHIAARKTYQRL
jgi:hypothetical protein